MSGWVPYQNNQSNNNNKKVNPEEILDLLLRNTANFKCDLVKRITEGHAIDLDQVKIGFGMLVDDTESAAMSCNYISKIKKKFVEEELDKEEIGLLKSLREYFRSKVNKDGPNQHYANAEIRARSMIREVIEGPYYAKLNSKIEELYEKGKNYSPSELTNKKYQLDSYRFQIIMESVTNQKAVKQTWNA